MFWGHTKESPSLKAQEHTKSFYLSLSSTSAVEMEITMKMLSNLVLVIVTLCLQLSCYDAAESTWWTQVSTTYPKYAEATTLLHEIESAYPDLVRIYSIGKSVE